MASPAASNTLNKSNLNISLSRQQENIPPRSGSPAHETPGSKSSGIASHQTEVENPRRVSWLRSNLDKVSHQNRQSDSPVNNTIQELTSSGKSKGASDDGTPVSGSPHSTDLPSDNRPAISLKSVRFPALTANDSILGSRSFLDDTSADISLINTDAEPHPTGIVLKRSGYYTIPSLEDLIGYLGEDGSCIVPHFTIGRKGYGSVYFDEPIDVAGLNLDELVHFRHKEVIIYPDDENKPPVGTELNRKAQITLDQVWPHDKTRHEPIKDKERLDALDYESKLRSVCDKHDTRFLEYRPETGSWVFRVDHFSKYGLSDSDDEEQPADAKKAKLIAQGKEGGQAAIATGAIPKQPLGKAVEKSKTTYEPEYDYAQGLGGFARYDKCRCFSCPIQESLNK